VRIAQITTMYYPELQFGGPPQKIHDLSRGLVGMGHAVQVVTVHSEQPDARYSFEVDGVSVQYLPWKGKAPWQVPFRLNTLWHAICLADVVHCYGLYNLLCPAAVVLARFARKPYILEPVGMYGLRGRKHGAKKVYNALVTSWMLRFAYRVVATSETEVADLEGAVGPDRLIIRRNGINVASFRQLPSPEIFRTLLALDPTERLILYVGRISPIKNLEALVYAFRQSALTGSRLVLVGPLMEPAYAERLRQLIETLGQTDRIILAGPLFGEEKLSALAAADLFVLPSLYESFGNAAAEAVAARVPVLLTDGCGIAPLINERAGLVVSHDADSLSSGLQRMLGDDALRLKFRRGCLEVAQEISWDAPLLQAEAIYQEVIVEARTGRSDIAA
jgi:glycosyltransferase involved in cell wall biosynthesis